MKNPKITVLLITVRPQKAYVNHRDWHVIGKIVECLNKQTYKDIEFICVDGLYHYRKDEVADIFSKAQFPCLHLPPIQNLWTKSKKPAICTYRNTGLSYARGELVINLDDCCTFDERYIEVFAKLWARGLCAATTWPEQNDKRPPGLVNGPAQVYGYGSYPLKAAIEIGGYDESYDGSIYLEDADWSSRLFYFGVKMALVRIPGFHLHTQSGHDQRVIPQEHSVKCCNPAWQCERVQRNVIVANTPDLWPREWLRKLIGPCVFMRKEDEACLHHQPPGRCQYVVDRYEDGSPGFVLAGHPIADQIYDNPPVFDLREARRRLGYDV